MIRGQVVKKSDITLKGEFLQHTNDDSHITPAERTAWNAKSNLALGTSSGTAFRGDHGKIAYDHTSLTNNPHNVTKGQLGLGNVENKSSATIRGELTSANVTSALGFTPVNKAGDTMTGKLIISNSTYQRHLELVRGDNTAIIAPSTGSLSGATPELRFEGNMEGYWFDGQLASSGDMIANGVNVNSHMSNTSNPHNVTKTQVGLGSVQNYPIASQAQAEAGTANNVYMTALRTMQGIVKWGEGFGIGSLVTQNVNWNDTALETGFYRGDTNGPVTTHCYGINVRRSNVYAFQIVGKYGRAWFRSHENGTWTPWREIASLDDLEAHKVDEAPHQYGGAFEWRYNNQQNTLDLVVLG